MIEKMVKNIFKRTIAFSLLILGIMMFIFKDYLVYIKGYVFGLSVSMLTFLLLVKSTKKASKMPPGSAETYAKKQYFIRMAIYFIVLTISAKADYLDFLSTFLGLVMIKIVIVISTIFKWEL